MITACPPPPCKTISRFSARSPSGSARREWSEGSTTISGQGRLAAPPSLTRTRPGRGTASMSTRKSSRFARRTSASRYTSNCSSPSVFEPGRLCSSDPISRTKERTSASRTARRADEIVWSRSAPRNSARCSSLHEGVGASAALGLAPGAWIDPVGNELASVVALLAPPFQRNVGICAGR
jgi:hypothetical protein